MEQVFSFKRWRLFAGLVFQEKKRLYILSTFTVFTLGLACFAIHLIVNGNSYFHRTLQGLYYFSGLFITGCLFASIQFSDLSEKSKGITYLTIPASHTEKWLTALFYSVPVFVTVYTLLFYSIDIPAVKISNSIRYQKWVKEQELKKLSPTGNNISDDKFKPAEIVNVLRYIEDTEYYSNRNQQDEDEVNYYRYIWLAFLAIQAFYALGSVYYGSFSFVKTTVSLLGLYIIFILFFQLLGAALKSNETLYYEFYELTYKPINGDEIRYTLPSWLKILDKMLLQYLFPPLFWWIALIRLKEKQI